MLPRFNSVVCGQFCGLSICTARQVNDGPTGWATARVTCEARSYNLSRFMQSVFAFNSSCRVVIFTFAFFELASSSLLTEERAEGRGRWSRRVGRLWLVVVAYTLLIYHSRHSAQHRFARPIGRSFLQSTGRRRFTSERRGAFLRLNLLMRLLIRP